MSDVKPRLARCFAAVFPQLREDEILAASPGSVAQWDSVAMVTLFNVIEEEFGITIDLDEVESLNSFEALDAYVGRVIAV